MNQTPITCPACGEIVLAWITDARTLVVPPHPDLVTPWVECGALAVAIESSSIPQ